MKGFVVATLCDSIRLRFPFPRPVEQMQGKQITYNPRRFEKVEKCGLFLHGSKMK